MGIATHPLCRVLYDYFFAPTVQRWTIELTNAKQCILADAASIRKHKSVLRRRPEKGIIRLALALGWVAIHLFAMVIFAFYGAFTAGPLHATWWFWSTGVAGVMYVLLMYSDPGFVTSEELKRLSEKAGLSCDVVGSDAGRGLLQDVDGEVPDMGMLPVPPPDVEEGEAGPSSAGASAGGSPDSGNLIAQARRRLDAVGGIDAIGYDLKPKGKGRHKVQPARRARALKHTLARNPRIVGYDEEGEAEAAEELERRAEWRRNQPLGIHDFFSGYCHEADMYLPIRAKFTKKHGRVVAKFDHYCYLLGNSIGEMNHGRFWRLLFAQNISIWTGYWLLTHGYISLHSNISWTIANAPLLALNLLTWIFGVPLIILLLIHTFNCLTSSTTYEFIKLEKLEYFNGFYHFSFPFSEGLCRNVAHFCCPSNIQLWRRAPPEDEWPESFWRNRYYSCCG